MGDTAYIFLELQTLSTDWNIEWPEADDKRATHGQGLVGFHLSLPCLHLWGSLYPPRLPLHLFVFLKVQLRHHFIHGPLYHPFLVPYSVIMVTLNGKVTVGSKQLCFQTRAGALKIYIAYRVQLIFMLRFSSCIDFWFSHSILLFIVKAIMQL